MQANQVGGPSAALADKRDQYESAFILLVEGFLRVGEHVEPVDSQRAPAPMIRLSA